MPEECTNGWFRYEKKILLLTFDLDQSHEHFMLLKYFICNLYDSRWCHDFIPSYFFSRKLKELQNDNDEKCQNIIKTTSENCQINLVEVDKVICLLYIVCELSTISARIYVIKTCSCSLRNKQYPFNIIVDYISIPNSFRFP